MQEKENSDEININTEEISKPDLSSSNNEQNNIIIDIPKNEENSETITIKPKLPKSDFEAHIIKAYRILVGLHIPLSENNTNNKTNKEINEEIGNKEKENSAI